LQAAAEGGAVHGTDDRLGTVLDFFQHPQEVAAAFLFTGSDLLEFVDVGAATKDSAGTRQDYRPNRVVLQQRPHRGLEAFQHSGTERVDGWVVEGDDADV